MSKVHEVLLKHGRITKEQFDRLNAKDADKKAAKERFKKDKNKLNKAELLELLDKLID